MRPYAHRPLLHVMSISHCIAQPRSAISHRTVLTTFHSLQTILGVKDCCRVTFRLGVCWAWRAVHNLADVIIRLCPCAIMPLANNNVLAAMAFRI